MRRHNLRRALALAVTAILVTGSQAVGTASGEATAPSPDVSGVVQGDVSGNGDVDNRTGTARPSDRQRTLAEKRLRDLVIHREAAGFRRNQVVYDAHPIPPPAR